MNTGKSFALNSVFQQPNYKSIVCVYFRVSLATEKHQAWKSHGFELYTDLPKGIIDLASHPRIIVQIDSLHRLRRPCDLLVLDEIESTISHMVNKPIDSYASESILKTKSPFDGSSNLGMYRALKDYTENAPKVYISDATLSDTIVDTLFPNSREVLKVDNAYQSFTDIKVNYSMDKTAVTEYALERLQQGKKLAIASNWKSQCAEIYSKIMSKIPTCRILRIDSCHGQDESVDNWSNYDVVIYSPTILAGVSFEKEHFDELVGFFNRMSCDAEMCLQMLCRVRKLKDKKMTIFTNADSKSISIPSEEQLDEWIQDMVSAKVRMGIEHVGLEISAFHNKAIKNKYYNLYKHVFKKQKVTTMMIHTHLQNLMESHGMNVTKFKYVQEGKSKKETLEYFKEVRKQNSEVKKEEKKEMIEAILCAKPAATSKNSVDVIVQSVEDTLRNASDSLSPVVMKSALPPVLPPDESEKYQAKQLYMQKSRLLSVFGKKEDEIDLAFVEKNLPRIQGYKNYKEFSDLRSFRTAIDRAQMLHNRGYDMSRKMESETAEDPDEQELCIVTACSYDNRYLKIRWCLQMLQAAGFKSLAKRDPIKLKWERLLKFCRENAKDLESVFNVTKKIEWGNEVDGKEKNRLLKFLRSKTLALFGITFEVARKFDKTEDTYTLKEKFLE